MSELSAMTVNERLFHVGVLEEWERAIKVKNREEMIGLLRRVELADQAEWITESVLRQQKR